MSTGTRCWKSGAPRGNLTLSRDYLSPVGKPRTGLVYGTMRGVVDFQRDYGLECSGCKNALLGDDESTMWCRYYGEEIHDYRIAEGCEGHDGRA